MRKSRKQVTALALALGMTAARMTGFEALAAEEETEVSTVDASGKRTMSMTIGGTIRATQVSVTVPLKAAFDVDPDKSGTATGKPSESKVDAGIITNVSNYTIINNSATPVWVYISKIETKTGSAVDATLGKDISLVGTVSALRNTADNSNVMIAIKKDGQFATLPMLNAVEGDGKNFWLVTGFNDNYYMDSDEKNEADTKGKLEAAGAAENANIMNLKIYVLTIGTWQDGSESVVMPTFTVSTTAPTTQTTFCQRPARKPQESSINEKGESYTATKIPCIPFGKKVKIAMVEQDIPQQKLAKRLDLANSIVSDIIYGRNQCERTKKRIADTPGTKG